MAKTPKGSGGTSRIRFIMLDAELPDGDLTQITQAIQNALRPTTVIQQRLPSATPAPSPQIPSASVTEPKSESIEEPIEAAESNGSQPRTPRQRKYREPKVVLDLDLTSEPSWASFATAKAPANHQMRFLVAAAWLKQHRGIEQVTMDHVYTCYRGMKWPTGIGDFDAPLRGLKQRQLLSKVGEGSYAINHIGLNQVDQLGA